MRIGENHVTMEKIIEYIEDEKESCKNQLRKIEKEQALLEGKRLQLDDTKTMLTAITEMWGRLSHEKEI